MIMMPRIDAALPRLPPPDDAGYFARVNAIVTLSARVDACRTMAPLMSRCPHAMLIRR